VKCRSTALRLGPPREGWADAAFVRKLTTSPWLEAVKWGWLAALDDFRNWLIREAA